jgi:rubrerythrin
VRVAPSTLDLLLKPLHRWVWTDPHRRARKLLTFAETEASGGRDLSRAAEMTRDPSLRRLFLRHAQDERRHADLFRSRGRELLSVTPRGSRFEARWLAPGERGLDELRVEGETDESLLAFLHLSEKAAAGRFALYGQVLDGDHETRAVFARVLEDEAFHMTYTRKQLARVAPRKQGLRLWQARAGRLWKAYLRIASALASVLGRLMLGIQYFVLLPPFALLAKRAARQEAPGFRAARSPTPLQRQY